MVFENVQEHQAGARRKPAPMRPSLRNPVQIFSASLQPLIHTCSQVRKKTVHQPLESYTVWECSPARFGCVLQQGGLCGFFWPALAIAGVQEILSEDSLRLPPTDVVVAMVSVIRGVIGSPPNVAILTTLCDFVIAFHPPEGATGNKYWEVHKIARVPFLLRTCRRNDWLQILSVLDFRQKNSHELILAVGFEFFLVFFFIFLWLTFFCSHFRFALSIQLLLQPERLLVPVGRQAGTPQNLEVNGVAAQRDERYSSG